MPFFSPTILFIFTNITYWTNIYPWAIQSIQTKNRNVEQKHTKMHAYLISFHMQCHFLVYTLGQPCNKNEHFCCFRDSNGHYSFIDISWLGKTRCWGFSNTFSESLQTLHDDDLYDLFIPVWWHDPCSRLGWVQLQWKTGFSRFECGPMERLFFVNVEKQHMTTDILFHFTWF